MKAKPTFRDARLRAWLAISIGLFGAACAEERAEPIDEPAPAVTRAEQALNSAPRSSDFVLEAANSVRIGSSANVVSGDVGARGTSAAASLSGSAVIDLGSSAKTPTQRSLIASSVRLGASAVAGDVQTSQLLGSGKHGAVSGLVALPTLPALADSVVGTTNLSVGSSKTVAATAGRYGTIDVGSKGVLRLAAGLYELRELSVGSSARVEVSGPVVLRIKERASLGSSSFVGAASGTSLDASALRLEFAGSSLTVGSSAQLTALVLAPNGTLSVGSSATLKGAFMARDIDVGSSASISFEAGFVTCEVAQCDDHDACTVDSCASNGTCAHAASPNGTACDDGNAHSTGDQCVAGSCRGTCTAGFAAATCSDIDECAATPSVCSAHAACTNSVGSYSCACTAGYVGNGVDCRTQVSAPVDPAQGGSVAVSDPASPIAGTRAEVPPQSSSAPIAIQISESTRTDVAAPAQAVSPVVHFEPEGVTFSPPVRLTLRFSPSRVGSGSSVSVLRLAAGASSWVEVEPVAVDMTAGTVQVLASRFSDWVVYEEQPASVPTCAGGPCQTSQLVFNGTWTCTYSALDDGAACDDNFGCSPSSACSAGACVPTSGCRPNMQCIGSGASGYCDCRPGYAPSANGCDPIDACAVDNGGCGRAICTRTAPGQRTCTCVQGGTFDGTGCVCPTGYESDGAAGCRVVNPCQKLPNGGCDLNASCNFVGPGRSTCTCRPPFLGDGMTCSCPTGYRQSGIGCTAIESCQMNNGGCDVQATCTRTGPGTNTCACKPGFVGDGFTCCPSGYERVDGECRLSSGFGLYGAVTHASSVELVAITPSSGAVASRGTITGLTTWSRVMQLDYGAKFAYATDTPASGTAFTYVFSLADGSSYSYASQVSGRLRDVIGTFYDRRIVGGRPSGATNAWSIYIDDTATKKRGNSLGLSPLRANVSSTAFTFDPGRSRVFVVGADESSPQQRLLSADFDTSLQRSVLVARPYLLGAVNAAGNLIAAYRQGASWIVTELNTQTGVASDKGVFDGLVQFDGVLSVDHVSNRVYAHGTDAQGHWRFYAFDLTTGVSSAFDDTSSEPANLVLVRATGSCLGDGCTDPDASDIDPCALGTASCAADASCTVVGDGEAECACNEGFEGDGYTCTAIEEPPPDEDPPPDEGPTSP